MIAEHGQQQHSDKREQSGGALHRSERGGQAKEGVRTNPSG